MATHDPLADLAARFAKPHLHVQRAVRPRYTAEKEWECRRCGLRWFLAPTGPNGGVMRYYDDGKSIVNIGARRGHSKTGSLPPCPRVALGTTESTPLKRDE